MGPKNSRVVNGRSTSYELGNHVMEKGTHLLPLAMPIQGDTNTMLAAGLTALKLGFKKTGMLRLV